MRTYLVNVSGIAHITYYIVKANDEPEAKRILLERLGKLGSMNCQNFQDITHIEFATVIDIDKQDYEG